jgi:HPt (histidine-containing phosphotransfer) domain-containing protein
MSNDGDHNCSADSTNDGAIDLEHLGRYTAGDDALRDELLGLFADQLACQLEMLSGHCIGDNWVIATHTLKGAARAVGAFAIAETAERLEKLDPANEAASVNELIALLHAQTETCRAFIHRISVAA